jgi:hypothetical protein
MPVIEPSPVAMTRAFGAGRAPIVDVIVALGDAVGAGADDTATLPGRQR